MAYMSIFRLEVRSYELDIYNHVNNAVYINWLEHARSKLLQDKGLNYISITKAWGVRFMTVRTEIDYRRQLILDDQVEIHTSVTKIGNTSFTLRQDVFRRGENAPAAEARVVIVYTDAKSGEPTPVPQEFVRLYA